LLIKFVIKLIRNEPGIIYALSLSFSLKRNVISLLPDYQRHTPGNGNHHCHHRENLRYSLLFCTFRSTYGIIQHQPRALLFPPKRLFYLDAAPSSMVSREASDVSDRACLFAKAFRNAKERLTLPQCSSRDQAKRKSIDNCKK